MLKHGDQLGVVLGVWGHPDDEAYLSAGVMAQAAGSGARVTCVTATKGEAGFPDDDPRSEAERMKVREEELAACLDELGVRDHRWLGYHDGRCDQVPVRDAVGRLVAIMEEVRPQTVLTFGPDGQTGHVDHIAVSRWTTLAHRQLRQPGSHLLYSTQTDEWNAKWSALVDMSQVMMVEGMQLPRTDESDLAVWVELDGEALEQKVRAMRRQRSQVEPLVGQVGPDNFRALVREEFFRPATIDDWP